MPEKEGIQKRLIFLDSGSRLHSPRGLNHGTAWSTLRNPPRSAHSNSTPGPRSRYQAFSISLASVKWPGILHSSVSLEVLFVVNEHKQSIGVLDNIVFFLHAFSQQKG